MTERAWVLVGAAVLAPTVLALGVAYVRLALAGGAR